jgi:hypothetical protein
MPAPEAHADLRLGPKSTQYVQWGGRRGLPASNWRLASGYEASRTRSSQISRQYG